MTDYFYQSRASRRPPEDDDRQQPAASRDSAYPPEDEAYWAEAEPPAPAEAPLWYEDRLRVASAEAAPAAEEDWREPDVEDEAGYPAPARAAHWAEPDDYAAEDGDEGDEGAYREDTPAPLQSRVYVPGSQAAAARAAAATGERNIRFDPTKERGALYYDKAARHTRHVRLLKFGLPTLAILSVAGFFIIMAINRGGDGLPALTLSGINLDTREITMDKPHISGFDGTKQSYEVNAAKAVQALGNPKVVNLETIDANFAVAEDVRAHLIAKSGIYDANTQKLQLDGGIDITTTNGYTGRLDHADIEIEKGTVFSDTGVDLAGKEGRITADQIQVLDHGKHIFFRGNVKVHFTPPEEEEGAATAAADATGPAPAAQPPVIQEPGSNGPT